MDADDDGQAIMENELDQQAAEELELKGDALNDGISECASGAGSRFSFTSRASPSLRASLRSQKSSPNRRRGRSDATYLKQPASRQRDSSAGSVSPAESHVSSMSLNTPARSTRSASTAAPSVDPRGDQELLQLMDVGDPTELVSLDLSLASKKTKKSLKNLQSLSEFVNLTELNVANNAIAALDGVDVFSELTVLNISRNHIKRVDPPLFALVNLRSLDLSGNFISHIPRGVGALEVLEVLNLSGNNLSALKEIDTLSKLTNLHTCNLAANPFCKLPTYKDYAVSKLQSLERLDDSIISDQIRDKSRRRFSEEMFSKDKCLREAGVAHASEQSKLREMQLALEAENVKLKDELQLKSKLLQNKSRAWSSATEQLLQLQHDLAMMNLDRRHGSPTDAVTDGAVLSSSHDCDPTSNQPELDPQSRTQRTSELQSASGVTVSHRNSLDQRNSGASDVSKENGLQDRQQSCGTSPVRGVHTVGRLGIRESSTQRGDVVDAACSPFFQPAVRADSKPRDIFLDGSDNSGPASPLSPPKPCEEPYLTHNGMLSPHDYSSRLGQDIALHHTDDGDEFRDEHANVRPSLQYPTFEDDSGCPAYDDPVLFTSSRTQPVAEFRQTDSKTRARTAEDSSFLQSPRSQRMWERQRSQLSQETSRVSPKKTQKRSQVVGLVEKENLVRQIQALQSCKQSFVAQIANEEQLLHELKRESSSYTNQIERLESDMQVLLGSRGARAGSTSQLREEETVRAKLEMLRNKLHYAEDKEGEIEATIVRMTKRVLEEDLQHAKEYGRSFSAPQAGHGHFDKEIFALTHNLQLVIIEKEEVHSEMSRLMNQLRSASAEGSSSQQNTGLSAQALLLIDQHEQLQRVSAANQSVFMEKQTKLDEFKRRLRDVHDRIKVKEDMLASLVAELKDVESELEYINELTPNTTGGHRRSLSLDSMPSSSGEASELLVAATSLRVTSPHTNVPAVDCSKSKSPRKISSTSPKKPSRGGPYASTDTHESISSMVEAAAADVNSQFEQKFKELFSPEVLESIKQDIYDKLSRQLPSSSMSFPSGSIDGRVDLHAAIATALDTHVKKAMETIEKQRDEDSRLEINKSPNSPKKLHPKGNSIASHAPHQDETGGVAKDREEERKCWDEVDDFMPVAEASYAAKFRFVKERAMAVQSPVANSKCSRTLSAQRIQKACDRLEQAESECRVDTFSGIEIDGSGKKKSDLKVVIMGARDLPTSHLRTKNLDPYVALEIVYPEHVRPQAKTTSVHIASLAMHSQGRHALISEQLQLPNQSFRSRTVKKSLYPVWDEEFEFAPVHSLKGYLHVRVLNDRKLSREQLVGEVKIPLRMLVDQRKVVESFVLRTSAFGSEGGQTRRYSGGPKIASSSTSGTIRIQLQLTFSRIERSKRAVDELVAKYLDEHNQLPPFIERIEEYESRLASPSPDPNNPEANLDEDRTPGSSFGTQPLASYESWKAHQPAAVSSGAESLDAAAHGQKPDEVPTTSPVDTVIGMVSQQASSLSSARSSALWSTPSTTRPTEASAKAAVVGPSLLDHNRGVNKKDDASRLVCTVRSTKPSATSSVKSASTSTSAKAAMAQLRQLVNNNKPTPAAATLQNAGAGFSILNNSCGNRRKTISTAVPPASSAASPDCFDDYSPYHPDFQLLDPLGMDSMGNSGGMHAAPGKTRSSSYSTALHRGYGDDRRTNLKIFKSPGFSRREPSGGFPERFIGLDTQTSERMKRIFGRMDNQT